MGVRLLERWLQNHSGATYPDSYQVHPAQRAQAYMAPFFPLRTNNYYWGRDIKSLGYGYNKHSLPRSGAGHSVARQAEGRSDCKSNVRTSESSL